MNRSIKLTIKGLVLIIPLFLMTMPVIAQDTNPYDEAKSEIKQQFGTIPSMFEAFPSYALPGAWENFKQLHGPESKIPPKYRELLQLAVASQIPCAYCVYFHSASAKAYGATEEEIQEAIAQGAQTRHWSMVLQGNQIDFEDFKAEFNAMMEYMSKQAEEN